MNREVQTSSPPRQRFLSWPHTRLGWWAAGLGLAALALPLLTTLFNALILLLSNGNTFALNAAGVLMLACAFAGGIIGVIALIRNRERSIVIWAAVLIGLIALLAMGHEFVPLR